MNTLIIKFKKAGATFNTAQEAFLDKTQLYSSELKARIEAVRQNLLDSGILLEPETYLWLPETSELQITRKVSDIADYKTIADDPETGWGLEGLLKSEEAGWFKSEYAVYDETNTLVGGSVLE